MKLVTGREFRFVFGDIDVTDKRFEYGAIVKMSFELHLPLLASDPPYYEDSHAFPQAGINYSGPGANADGTPVTSQYAIYISYWAIMVPPSASGPAPLSTNNTVGTGTRYDTGTMRWRWTAGNSGVGYTSDVVIADSGDKPVNDTVLSPIGYGSGHFSSPGLFYVINYNNNFPVVPFSGMFPPEDSHNTLRLLSTNALQDWDGWTYMNLYANVTAHGVQNYSITAANWRFVHLFHEIF